MKPVLLRHLSNTLRAVVVAVPTENTEAPLTAIEAWALSADEHIADLDDLLINALIQGTGGIRKDGYIDNECLSTWEAISAYLAERRYLEDVNGRLYRPVERCAAEKDPT
jgi:hypothetical protein